MSRWWPVVAVAAIMVILTNGPVFLFSKRILDRTALWEDPAVWPFFAAAACASAALAALAWRRGSRGMRWADTVASAADGDAPPPRADTANADRHTDVHQNAAGFPTDVAADTADADRRTDVHRRALPAVRDADTGNDPVSRLAAAAVACYSLAAVASAAWSVDRGHTLWRSLVYLGLAMLAAVIAGWGPNDRLRHMLTTVAAAAVAGSLLLTLLRPDIGVDHNGDWRGLYTNRNSLAPLAALGVVAGVGTLLAGGRSQTVKVGLDTGPGYRRLRSTLSGLSLVIARRVGGGVLVVMSAAALVGAGSRTAWLALLIGTGVSALIASARLMLDRSDADRVRLRPTRYGALGKVAAAAAVSTAAAGAVVSMAVLWNAPTLAQRRTIWRLVWERILERPLGGHGFFTFWDKPELVAAHELLRRGSAHNSLMETGLGLGLLGVAPFVVIVVLAARNAVCDLWRRPGVETWTWAAAVGVMLVENVTESFVLWFSYNWVLVMAAALRAPARSAAVPVRRVIRGSVETLADRVPPRLRSGWTAVALISLTVLAVWLPDLDLPLGNSDDGRILGRFGLHARNFWELGPIESRFGAVVEPFIRAEFNVAPRSEPPEAAVTYAHHPPLSTLISIASVGLLGDNLPALRIAAFLMGSATVAFMATLLRVRGMAWGPTLLAVGAMASTGFFYVYARIGVGYSLLVASTAAVAWLREAEQPSRPALIGVGSLAAVTAMQSWIAMAALAMLVVWMLTARARSGEPVDAELAVSESAMPAMADPGEPTAEPDRLPDARDGVRAGTRIRVAAMLSPGLVALAVGAASGALITAAWMINATDIAELAERVAFRTGTDVRTVSQQTDFGFGEFLARQWRFAGHELMAPPWLRLLLLPALIAGLADRRTRAPTAITLAAAAVLTFAFMQGAWIHRLWNFPWLAPTTIGMAALFDAARRAMRGRAARLRAPAGVLAAAAAVTTLIFVVTGGTRGFYLADPAHAGAVLAEADDQVSVELVWVAPGIPTPRWVSYYLDAPVSTLDEGRLDDVEESDVVLVRSNRVPGYFPDDALDHPIASHGEYRLIRADRIMP